VTLNHYHSQNMTAKNQFYLISVIGHSGTKWLSKVLHRPSDRTDINRKIEGNRSPSFLWRQWSEEQRKTFINICGPAMINFGYNIPNRI
jgi:hypothetical protein